MTRVISTIDHESFPEQGCRLATRVRVMFQCDTENILSGVCVRHDITEPGRMIFRLDDGRYILDSECQWS